MSGVLWAVLGVACLLWLPAAVGVGLVVARVLKAQDRQVPR
jgi:type IV secretory pathway TrbD component